MVRINAFGDFATQISRQMPLQKIVDHTSKHPNTCIPDESKNLIRCCQERRKKSTEVNSYFKGVME
jgi:hypothetical protein